MSKKVKYYCNICNKYFLDFKSSKRKYCSRKCFEIAHKVNMSGKNNPMYSKPPSIKSIMALRKYIKTHDVWNKGKKCPQLQGSKNPLWKGGRIKHQRGYILIYKPEHPFATKGGYVFEHRLIIEKQIGRYLKSKEVVHHINGNPSDNRLGNLMLFSSNSEHNIKYKQIKSRPLPIPNKVGEIITIRNEGNNGRRYMVNKCLKCKKLYWKRTDHQGKICGICHR